MVGGSSVKESNSNTYTTGTPFSSTTSVSVRVQTAAGCIATDTLDLFYNDIDVKGTIGQISSTLCPNEIPPAFTNVASATATLGTISYRWQTRTSGTNFENTIPLVTTEVYTPTTGLTTTTFFRFEMAEWHMAISCNALVITKQLAFHMSVDSTRVVAELTPFLSTW